MAVKFSEERLGLILGLLNGKRCQLVHGEKNYIQNKITCRNSSVLAPEWIKLFNKFKTK